MRDNPMASNDVTRAAWRGAVAAMAMSGMRRLTVSLGLVERPPPEEIAEEGVPGLFSKIPVEYREPAVELAHWSYGTGMGVTYGMLPRAVRSRPWFGIAFGLGSWAFFERVVAPMLRLRRPEQRKTSERVAIALDHVLYGVVVSHRPFDPTD